MTSSAGLHNIPKFISYWFLTIFWRRWKCTWEDSSPLGDIQHVNGHPSEVNVQHGVMYWKVTFTSKVFLMRSKTPLSARWLHIFLDIMSPGKNTPMREYPYMDHTWFSHHISLKRGWIAPNQKQRFDSRGRGPWIRNISICNALNGFQKNRFLRWVGREMASTRVSSDVTKNRDLDLNPLKN